jgi:hypothetical protein
MKVKPYLSYEEDYKVVLDEQQCFEKIQEIILSTGQKFNFIK